MKRKHYKPGQLVTIEGRVYRIKKAPFVYLICTRCDAKIPCYVERKIYKFCTKNIPLDCNLELVKPKQK